MENSKSALCFGRLAVVGFMIASLQCAQGCGYLSSNSDECECNYPIDNDSKVDESVVGAGKNHYDHENGNDSEVTDLGGDADKREPFGCPYLEYKVGKGGIEGYLNYGLGNDIHYLEYRTMVKEGGCYGAVFGKDSGLNDKTVAIDISKNGRVGIKVEGLYLKWFDLNVGVLLNGSKLKVVCDKETPNYTLAIPVDLVRYMNTNLYREWRAGKIDLGDPIKPVLLAHPLSGNNEVSHATDGCEIGEDSISEEVWFSTSAYVCFITQILRKMEGMYGVNGISFVIDTYAESNTDRIALFAGALKKSLLDYGICTEDCPVFVQSHDSALMNCIITGTDWITRYDCPKPMPTTTRSVLMLDVSTDHTGAQFLLNRREKKDLFRDDTRESLKSTVEHSTTSMINKDEIDLLILKDVVDNIREQLGKCEWDPRVNGVLALLEEIGKRDYQYIPEEKNFYEEINYNECLKCIIKSIHEFLVNCSMSGSKLFSGSGFYGYSIDYHLSDLYAAVRASDVYKMVTRYIEDQISSKDLKKEDVRIMLSIDDSYAFLVNMLREGGYDAVLVSDAALCVVDDACCAGALLKKNQPHRCKIKDIEISSELMKKIDEIIQDINKGAACPYTRP